MHAVQEIRKTELENPSHYNTFGNTTYNGVTVIYVISIKEQKITA